ncbi:MAG TPA: RNA polymerase sigma factor [Planctomycetota bacterium]|nr:RNA polymerase sigma factor [Planctomycetota bacterium]
MQPSPTKSLLRSVSRGDAAALGELVERQLPVLRAWVRLRMGPGLAARESSMDIVQSACREVIQDISSEDFPSEGHFRCRLFQAVGRKLIDKARYHGAEKRDVAHVADLPGGALDEVVLGSYASLVTPSAIAIGRELAERLERAFAQLDDDERDIIVMAKLAGLSHAEIAAETGRREGAVRTALYRALGRLSALVEGQARTSGAD